jgi:hypothetical protein
MPGVQDCEGNELNTGDRVMDDGWFGAATVVRLRIPLASGPGFNVGLRWDDASKGGPKVREGGRGANHLRRIGGSIAVAQEAAATAWTAETMQLDPRFEDFVAFVRNENEDADWECDGEPETVELWVDWLCESSCGSIDDAGADQGGAAEDVALHGLSDLYTGEFEAAVLDSTFQMTLIPDEPRPTPPNQGGAAEDVALHGLSDLYTGEFEAAVLDSTFKMTLISDEPRPTPPKPAPYVGPEEGTFVTIHGATEHAFVFTSTATLFGVCYRDQT